MNCTAFGLMVAIPLVLIHSMLQTKTTAIIDSLEMASVKFLNAITERAQEAASSGGSRLAGPGAAPRLTRASRADASHRGIQSMQAIGRSARMARHHKRHRAAEINLVSMIDMMTILVFFLLVHGGFVRLAILELNLPTAQSQVAARSRPSSSSRSPSRDAASRSATAPRDC